ncbi:Fanconi anemia group I protein homolog isoform X1 [Pieris rapae]|uniref:Fanconi anemia group I protein homolog isoform X1 n=3 Tax=Pieris rapae TaxID=64459 RepID=UPI001E27EBB5|nr:Fanconi anemia group I protein homolog isoform X1 [Pieris rapae]
MDTNKIFSVIKEIGHINNKKNELRNYCKIKFSEIISGLSYRILKSDGADIIDCIFDGLTDGPEAYKNKVKVIDIVLKTMRKESTSLTHCGDVISRLCLELPRMPIDDLLRWNNDSVQSIVDDNDVNMIWRDVLPECLKIVSSQISIKQHGTDMSGTEYKAQCIHILCMCQWKERQLVSLTAMFKDIHLSQNDHKQVVNKICTYITDTPPEALPPLVHQLLKLCKVYNMDVVLAHLSQYFNLHLYSKLEPPPQDSESTTADLDDIVRHSHAELSRCLSTSLYHITQGAAEPELIRRHIKQWPKSQLLRAPFLLDLALAVSDKGTEFRSVCLEVIKSAIEQRTSDDQRSKESAWVRSVLPPDVDVANVLKVLTTESANHRELTVRGLINLAFSLLSVSRVKAVSHACWSHGKLILVRLCKSQPNTAQHILAQLADRLSGDCSQRQYSDCLYVLCKLTPVSVESCTQLSTILENCQPGGDYTHAAAVYAAVHPLITFSTRTRDTLVMVCRKGLYSRDSQYRCLSLLGFLTVLKHMKLSSYSLSSSQSGCSEQFSTHSYLTQLTVDLHATQQGSRVTSRVRNEAICLEVVSILRRCLVQDALVKQLLYTEMYECAKEKPALHESILELFYEHVCKFLAEDGESPILWDKCVQTGPVTANLIEPIGRLLYAIAQFLQPTEEESDDILGSPGDSSVIYLRRKLVEVMNRMDGETLLNVDSDDIGVSDLTPESKAKKLKVQQALQCYETLIAHKIMQWTPHTSHANSVYNLYKIYTQLLDNSKTTPKGKKSKLNDTKETVKSQSQKSQKGKAPVKLANLVKDRAGPFKPLPCLWDLGICYRILDLLYSDEVTWSSLEQRNLVRSKRDFHHFTLRCTQSVLNEKLEKHLVATHVFHIAALLYKRCLCRFQELSEFDDSTALGCLEVFKSCVNLLLSTHYSFKIESVLSGITGEADVTASINMSNILRHTHTALVQLEAEGAMEERDVLLKKHTAMLIQIANLLLETPVVACAALHMVTSKLEDYVHTCKQDCIQLIGSLLTASHREHREAPLLDQLLTKLTRVLGKIDEEESSSNEDSDDFPSIDSRTGHIVLNTICIHLNSRFKCTEHLLNRSRDLAVALNNTTHTHEHRISKELLELYKSIVIQLCGVGGWIARICSLRCCVGVGSERVLGACTRLYTLLATLLKRLTSYIDMVPMLRLERLLKVCGKKLSSVTDCLITYLEASQEHQKASKVLRDTKLIPRLVLEAEQFSKHAILLGNKVKLNFQQYLSLGTARDFRIKAPVLMEALNAEIEENNDPGEDINDAATEILSPVGSDSGQSDDEVIRKRRRMS